MRAVCFHGRRELDMSGDFLLAAQILGAAAAEASLSAQVRTPAWPSPPGSPDRAVIRLNSSPFEDMDIPRKYDLEVVCDPTLAVIPPMGNALLPGGLLIANAPEPPVVPADGPRTVSADLTALALSHGLPLGYALSGAAWAGLAVLASEWSPPFEALETGAHAVMPEPAGNSVRDLLREAHQQVSLSLAENS
jgi:Pyruvate/2-oxoacid:ferredoxin oxidoreductase gamma subunit